MGKQAAVIMLHWTEMQSKLQHQHQNQHQHQHQHQQQTTGKQAVVIMLQLAEMKSKLTGFRFWLADADRKTFGI